MHKNRKDGGAVLKIAICDDEKEFRSAAEQMLKLYMADKSAQFLADTFDVSSDLIDATEKGTIYDIYLLDIYMPGITGMSIATELRSRSVKSPVIFLTSSTDHALEAFGVDATHYLLKPYTKDNFYVGMDKAMQSITSHKDDSIVLKVDNEYRSISISKILYCEAKMVSTTDNCRKACFSSIHTTTVPRLPLKNISPKQHSMQAVGERQTYTLQ